jgi:hypothetical protein
MKTKILALLVIFSFVVFSCQKKDETASTIQTEALLKSATITATDVAVQSASLEATFEADFYAGFERVLRELSRIKGNKGDLMSGRKDLHYILGQTPVVTIDTATAGYPITITISYGNGIETKQGKVISGTVKIEINGDEDTDGSTRQITFTDCKVDTIGVNGICIEKFTGDNLITRKITNTSDVTFTITNGATLVRKGTETSEWLAGVSTPEERDDDKIVITGSNIVENKTENITYSRTITDGLIKLGDCRNIVAGTVEISQNGNVIATLNYGDGTCDNLASLTTNGTTTEITLKGPGEGKGEQGNGPHGKQKGRGHGKDKGDD